MNRDEFLNRRLAGIGGSDIAAILGISKFKSAVDVWLDKTGRSERTDSTIPQRFGNFAEDFVAKEYTAKTGRKVIRHNAQLVHPEHSFLIGNVDRLVIPEGQKIAAFRGEIRTDRGMEAKCVSAYAGGEWGDDDSDNVPPFYLAQCAWYQMLTGCKYWDLAALIGNSRVEVYTLQRDLELEKMLLARAVEFWTQHVLTDIPPEPQSAADIAALYPQSAEGIKTNANQEILESIEKLRWIREVLKDAQVREENELVKIKNHMQLADALVLVDAASEKVLATWRNNKDSVKIDYEAALADVLAKFDTDQAEQLRQEVVAKYRTVTRGARPFKLK